MKISRLYETKYLRVEVKIIWIIFHFPCFSLFFFILVFVNVCFQFFCWKSIAEKHSETRSSFDTSHTFEIVQACALMLIKFTWRRFHWSTTCFEVKLEELFDLFFDQNPLWRHWKDFHSELNYDQRVEGSQILTILVPVVTFCCLYFK